MTTLTPWEDELLEVLPASGGRPASGRPFHAQHECLRRRYAGTQISRGTLAIRASVGWSPGSAWQTKSSCTAASADRLAINGVCGSEPCQTVGCCAWEGSLRIELLEEGRCLCGAPHERCIFGRAAGWRSRALISSFIVLGGRARRRPANAAWMCAGRLRPALRCASVRRTSRGPPPPEHDTLIRRSIQTPPENSLQASLAKPEGRSAKFAEQFCATTAHSRHAAGTGRPRARR